VLATLFTTLVMTLMLYGRNRRSLGDRTGQELRGASSDAAARWACGSTSGCTICACGESLRRIRQSARATGRSAAQSLNRLRDYLNSVRQNLPAHEGLAIIGRTGSPHQQRQSDGIPRDTDRLNNLRTRDALVGERSGTRR